MYVTKNSRQMTVAWNYIVIINTYCSTDCKMIIFVTNQQHRNYSTVKLLTTSAVEYFSLDKRSNDWSLLLLTTFVQTKINYLLIKVNNDRLRAQSPVQRKNNLVYNQKVQSKYNNLIFKVLLLQKVPEIRVRGYLSTTTVQTSFQSNAQLLAENLMVS